jgi:hypothetical protein
MNRHHVFPQSLQENAWIVAWITMTFFHTLDNSSTAFIKQFDSARQLDVWGEDIAPHILNLELSPSRPDRFNPEGK